VFSFELVDGESIAQKKSYDFALQIIRLCIRLKEEKHFELARQLLRAGTSVGANVEEALAALEELVKILTSIVKTVRTPPGASLSRESREAKA